jgi:hypothetical protein
MGTYSLYLHVVTMLTRAAAFSSSDAHCSGLQFHTFESVTGMKRLSGEAEGVKASTKS